MLKLWPWKVLFWTAFSWIVSCAVIGAFPSTASPSAHLDCPYIHHHLPACTRTCTDIIHTHLKPTNTLLRVHSSLPHWGVTPKDAKVVWWSWFCMMNCAAVLFVMIFFPLLSKVIQLVCYKEKAHSYWCKLIVQVVNLPDKLWEHGHQIHPLWWMLHFVSIGPNIPVSKPL